MRTPSRRAHDTLQHCSLSFSQLLTPQQQRRRLQQHMPLGHLADQGGILCKPVGAAMLKLDGIARPGAPCTAPARPAAPGCTPSRAPPAARAHETSTSLQPSHTAAVHKPHGQAGAGNARLPCCHSPLTGRMQLLMQSTDRSGTCMSSNHRRGGDATGPARARTPARTAPARRA